MIVKKTATAKTTEMSTYSSNELAPTIFVAPEIASVFHEFHSTQTYGASIRLDYRIQKGSLTKYEYFLTNNP
jgi:hypothetical protein